MSRRIDIELTSARPDGSFTWRAAGAREPKGVVDGSVLPAGSKPGSVLRAEAEFELDGITILSAVDPKGRSEKSGLLELKPSATPFEAVTQQLARRERGDRGDRRDRPRGDRPRTDRPRTDRPRSDRGDRPRGDRPPSGRPGDDRDRTGSHRRPPREGDAAERRGPRPERRQRPQFTPPPELPQRPKAKRLKPGRAHRNHVLAELPEEQRAVAERALQGGIPAVRQAVAEQNARLKSEGKDEIPAAGLVSLAEQLLPKLRVAEWLDRADAAKADIDDLDLRDLRSVVAAGDDPMVARDESTRVLADELKQALAAKQEKELNLWYGDIDAALGVGRVIRALKLSSQPPKAGVRFPPELAKRLADATTASLTPDALNDRWSAVLEAAAFSPVRAHVTPTTAPPTVSDDLRATVTRLGPLLPQIAELFGIEVRQGAAAPKPLRPTKPAKPAAKTAKAPTKPAAARPAPEPKPAEPAAPSAPEPAPAATEAEPDAGPDEHEAIELASEPDATPVTELEPDTVADIVTATEHEATSVVDTAIAPPEALTVVEAIDDTAATDNSTAADDTMATDDAATEGDADATTVDD